MSFALKNSKAVIITYFRDVLATFGIPIVVLVYSDYGEVGVHIRKNWRPVLTYDKDVELEFLQSFVHEHVPPLTQDISVLTTLSGAENSIRAEELATSDPLFDQKLADALRSL
jgi:hypothetical protein